ncbi:MAG: ExbD/TolR family protein [Gammaproteobacteria bacterium]
MANKSILFQQKKARIEIINLIDVMLFLLVFFVEITIHMIPATGVQSKLPVASTAQALNRTHVVISLLPGNHIYVNENQVTPSQLTTMLLKDDPKKTSVTIAGAKKVTLQELLTVMDAIRNARITAIGIVGLKSS